MTNNPDERHADTDLVREDWQELARNHTYEVPTAVVDYLCAELTLPDGWEEKIKAFILGLIPDTDIDELANMMAEMSVIDTFDSYYEVIDQGLTCDQE